MIIFQTASGSGGSLTLGGGLLADRDRISPTTFRNNTYIHRLNRTLQAEMRAISAYQTLGNQAYQAGSGASSIGTFGDKACVAHQAAGKQLVCLIIANRGVPEDRAALSLGLTRTFIQFCTAMPTKLFERATASTLITLERQLTHAYDRLIKEAPFRDVEALEVLRTETQRRVEELRILLS